VARDRLGSVRGSASVSNHPYGENYSASNTDGFATYYQDSSTGLNYADQRYYNATFGRFISVARRRDRAALGSPQAWNRYAYAKDDPVNRIDPSGNDSCFIYAADNETCISTTPTDPPACPSDEEQFADGSSGSSDCSGDGGDGGDGGSGDDTINVFAGGETKPITVTGFSQSGQNQATIANVLGDVMSGLAAPGGTQCATWLQGSGSVNPSALISALISGNSFGHGAFSNNTTAAFAGTRNADGSPTGVPGSAAFAVNDNGAFFNSTINGENVTVGPNHYTGGSLQAQAAILIHEIAHIMNPDGGAPGFQKDFGNDKAGRSNDNLVNKNCGKLIGGLK
jgi:RHS repeat-associated protein